MTKRPTSTIPRYKRRRQRSVAGRIFGFIFKLILIFLLGSVLWVLAYRFINPPITATMLGDVLAGRGASRDWMPIEQIDRDMVRAAIAGEDSKFCSHDGFDFEAIEDANAAQCVRRRSAALDDQPQTPRTPSCGKAGLSARGSSVVHAA